MVDLHKKYVRVTGIKNDQYVEFDFSFEDPELFVELVLPFEMFEIFCEKNNVSILPAEDSASSDYQRMLWRLGKASSSVLKQPPTTPE